MKAKQFYHLGRLGLFLLVLLSFNTALAQDSKYGYQLPTEGTVRVLVIFAEVSQTGTCTTPAYNGDWSWPSGPAAPPNADNYLDPNVLTNPVNKISKYYKDISFGELNVIGDYFDRTVQVPCTSTGLLNSTAITQLQSELTANSITTTRHGLTINDFDLWQNGSAGMLRSPTPDGNIDAIVIVWRNHPSYSCGSGLGVGNYISGNILGKSASLFGAWDGCPGGWAASYDRFFVAEFFHALFGGNNFHTGGGAAVGTTMFDGVASFSTTGQNGSASNIVCGWDRNFMDWKGTRTYPISALNQSNTEVVSDITIVSHPNTSYFVLRDFVTVGDALRIKLPHLNWTANGDNKNQYLWVENHQVGKTGSSQFDIDKGCIPWSAGLYMYIQVGKEVISGTTSQVYGGSPYAARNALEDYLIPIPAEGNYDFYYEYATANLNPMNCAWNNYSLPFSKYYPDGTTKANPLTGYNDLSGGVDSNQNGVYDAGDVHQPNLQKYLGVPNGSPPNPTIPRWGDDLDAFTTTGQKIAIGTNPSSATVYTSTQGLIPPLPDYDNETVRLNNLSVTIVNDNYYNETNPNNPRAFLVCVKWDDSDIAQDVRWCGNITAGKDLNDPANRNTQINVLPNKCITLDRGLSPTQLTSTLENSVYYFTKPTCLHLLDGSSTSLQANSCMNVINGSTLHLGTGSNLIIGPNATITVDATSYICIDPGANITFQDPVTSRIVVNGVSFSNFFTLTNVILANAPANYHAYTSIVTNGTTQMPATGAVDLEAGQIIRLQPNTLITPASVSNSFRAHITPFPSNCSNYQPLENGVLNDRECDDEVHSDYSFLDELWYINHPFYEEVEPESTIVSDVLIYPNPSHDVFHVQLPDDFELEEIVVVDMNGGLIEKRNFAKQFGGVVDIELSGISTGIYLVHVIGSDRTIVKRIMKE